MRRKRDNRISLAGEKRTSADQECARIRPRDLCERVLKIVRARHSEYDNPQSDRARCSLNFRQAGIKRGVVRVTEHSNSCRLGHQVVQQFHPLGIEHAATEECDASEIALGLAEAPHQPGSDGSSPVTNMIGVVGAAACNG